MKKYKITLQDCFSFAIEVRTANLSEKQYNSVLNAIENKVIVFSKTINQISWNFVPVKIEAI